MTAPSIEEAAEFNRLFASLSDAQQAGFLSLCRALRSGGSKAAAWRAYHRAIARHCASERGAGGSGNVVAVEFGDARVIGGAS